jgi:hypothetical protein
MRVRNAALICGDVPNAATALSGDVFDWAKLRAETGGDHCWRGSTSTLPAVVS